MSANAPGTVQIGELVVAAFDWAARFSEDPKQVSRLASIVVKHVLERVPRAAPPAGAETAWDEIETAVRKRADKAPFPPVAARRRRRPGPVQPSFLRIEGKRASS